MNTDRLSTIQNACKALVVYDYENEPLTGNSLGYKRLDAITSFIEDYGVHQLQGELDISYRAYANWADETISKGKEFLKEVLSDDLTLVNVETGEANAVDFKLLDDIKGLISGNSYDVIALVAGDGDYLPLFDLVVSSGTKLIVFARGDNISNDYIKQSDRVLSIHEGVADSIAADVMLVPISSAYSELKLEPILQTKDVNERRIKLIKLYLFAEKRRKRLKKLRNVLNQEVRELFHSANIRRKLRDGVNQQVQELKERRDLLYNRVKKKEKGSPGYRTLLKQARRVHSKVLALSKDSKELHTSLNSCVHQAKAIKKEADQVHNMVMEMHDTVRTIRKEIRRLKKEKQLTGPSAES